MVAFDRTLLVKISTPYLRSGVLFADFQAESKAVNHVMPRRGRDFLIAPIEERNIAARHIRQRHFRMQVARVAVLKRSQPNIRHL